MEPLNLWDYKIRAIFPSWMGHERKKIGNCSRTAFPPVRGQCCVSLPTPEVGPTQLWLFFPLRYLHCIGPLISRPFLSLSGNTQRQVFHPQLPWWRWAGQWRKTTKLGHVSAVLLPWTERLGTNHWNCLQRYNVVFGFLLQHGAFKRRRNTHTGKTSSRKRKSSSS